MSKKIEQPKPETERRDHLTTTTKDGKIELTEEELNRVPGGGFRQTAVSGDFSGKVDIKWTTTK